LCLYSEVVEFGKQGWGVGNDEAKVFGMGYNWGKGVIGEVGHKVAFGFARIARTLSGGDAIWRRL
jgi:hypothetical protein